MKNIISTLVILGAILTGSNALAGEPILLPSEKPGNSTMVTFDNVKHGSKLYIRDISGNKIYSEKLKTEGSIRKNFDLSQLPENEYFFEVDKKGLISQIPFNVKNGEVELLENLKRTIFKPSLKLHGETVSISRIMEGTETFNIEIYYEGNELAYTEDIERTGEFRRSYDFSKSATGQYLFSIEYDDNRIYTEYINIITMY